MSCLHVSADWTTYDEQRELEIRSIASLLMSFARKFIS